VHENPILHYPLSREARVVLCTHFGACTVVTAKRTERPAEAAGSNDEFPHPEHFYYLAILRPYVASPVLSQQVLTKTGPFTALRGTHLRPTPAG
jgi:hypothetical protein